MYADPSNLRRRVTKMNFNDEELDLLIRAAAKKGMQPAAYAREAIIEGAKKKLKELGLSVEIVSK